VHGPDVLYALGFKVIFLNDKPFAAFWEIAANGSTIAANAT
jgi:hypothetical protein